MFIIPSIDLSMKLSLSEVFVSNIIVTMVISNKSCCKHVLFTNLSDFISTTTRVTSVKSKKFLFCSFSVAKFGIAPTVDRVVQSKEDGKLCLGCLGVDLQGSCSQSFLCLPGSLGSQSFLCLPGSLGSLLLVPESAGQIEEGREDNEAQGDDVDDQVSVHAGGDSEVGVRLRVLLVGGTGRPLTRFAHCWSLTGASLPAWRLCHSC